MDTNPTNTAKLSALRNKRKLKHVMLGKKIWSSLTSSYKIEISGKVSEFERSGEYDGVLLWEFIWRRVNPTTTVGASNFKAEIERATLADHENSVVTFNIQFDDTRTKIVKEEGGGGIMNTSANFSERI